jgi:hypothetical protein
MKPGFQPRVFAPKYANKSTDLAFKLAALPGDTDYGWSPETWQQGYTNAEMTPAGAEACSLPDCACDWRYHITCTKVFTDTFWPGDGHGKSDDESFSKGYPEVQIGWKDAALGFTTFPVELGRRLHSATEMLSLHDNQITQIEPGAFAHLSVLNAIVLSNNDLDSDFARPGQFEGMAHILTPRYLNNLNLKRLTNVWHFTGKNGTHGRGMPHMRYLTFSTCSKMTVIDDDACCHMYPLIEVRCSSLVAELCT